MRFFYLLAGSIILTTSNTKLHRMGFQRKFQRVGLVFTFIWVATFLLHPFLHDAHLNTHSSIHVMGGCNGHSSHHDENKSEHEIILSDCVLLCASGENVFTAGVLDYHFNLFIKSKSNKQATTVSSEYISTIYFDSRAPPIS